MTRYGRLLWNFMARALYAPSILPRACVGVTP